MAGWECSFATVLRVAALQSKPQRSLDAYCAQTRTAQRGASALRAGLVGSAVPKTLLSEARGCMCLHIVTGRFV